jgi:hypothetical protein
MLLMSFSNVFHAFFAVAIHIVRHIQSCSPVMPGSC